MSQCLRNNSPLMNFIWVEAWRIQSELHDHCHWVGVLELILLRVSMRRSNLASKNLPSHWFALSAKEVQEQAVWELCYNAFTVKSSGCTEHSKVTCRYGPDKIIGFINRRWLRLLENVEELCTRRGTSLTDCG
jgi:hypothetical protein